MSAGIKVKIVNGNSKKRLFISCSVEYKIIFVQLYSSGILQKEVQGSELILFHPRYSFLSRIADLLHIQFDHNQMLDVLLQLYLISYNYH